MHTYLYRFLLVMLLGIFPARAQQATLPGAQDDAAARGFGRAIAVAGDAAFIGEPSNVLGPGAVYVFGQEAGVWTEQQRLTASDATVADGFGWAVDGDGDVLLVGAPSQEGGRGAAYVFRKDAASGHWIEEARLTAQQAVAGGEVGLAVALRGDVALVGASLSDEAAGAAYLFRYDAASGIWHQQARLTAADGQTGDRFGASVALAEDEAIVGAYRHNDGIGAAYVFRRDAASGLWQQQDKLTATDTDRNDIFGFSMTVHEDEVRGDELLIGAPQHNDLEGAAYLFRKNAATGQWQEQDKRLGSTLDAGGRYGWALAMAGDAMWIAAPFADDWAGAVYVFRRDSPTAPWRERERLAGSEAGRSANFGRFLALGATYAVAGSQGEDFGAGAAYVFERDDASGAWTEQARVIGSDAGPEAIVGETVACTAGIAALFPCGSVDLMAFLPTRAIGGARGAGTNDLWGWTDPETGREYALVGRIDGTAFVDVSDPENPVYLGNLPTNTVPATWRDIKTYANHAFIVADGALDHGMQIFDLTRLRAVTNPPVTFSETARYDNINSAHNVAINEETGFAYIVGAGGGGQTCGGGLHMVDVRTPTSPVFAGCFADRGTGRNNNGYTHDVQCVVYRGPDAQYRGQEICFGSNETALSIADVTEKDNPVALAVGTYPDAGYTHQGWLTEDHRYFFQDDELDELRLGGRTRTLVWDVTDLDDPQLLLEHEGETSASDHNQYIAGNYLFQSNYSGGLRVLDITTVSNPVEVAFFDVYPAHDNPGFSGSWSNYPFFASGTVLLSGREAGLFIVKPTAIQLAAETQDLPETFALSPAYPNPFNPATTLTLTLPQAQPVSVAAYDLLGREVALLRRGTLVAGTHRLVFDATGLPSGVYMIRAEGRTASWTQTVTLVR